MNLEKWFLQCRLDNEQREVVEEMLRRRDDRIAELVAQVNELSEELADS